MANIKISELNELTSVASDDVLPIVDTSLNETKKVSVETLIPEIKNTYSESQEDAYSCDYINGTVLHNNNSGTALSIILSDSLANYSKIGIEYMNGSSVYCYQEFLNPNSNTLITLFSQRSAQGALVIWQRELDCSGTTISTSSNRWSRLTLSTSGISVGQSQTTNDLIQITKVIGFK